MGGFHAPIAAIAVALFALALGPASAAAEGPLDPASAVQSVQQRAAEIADPALQQAAAPGLPAPPAPAAAREAPEPAASRAPDPQRMDSETGSPVARDHVPPSTPTASAPRAVNGPAGEPRQSRAVHRRAAARTGHQRQAAPSSSPTRTQERTPAAPRPDARTSGAVPVPDRSPGDAGTTAGPHGFAVPGGFLFAAFLIVLIAASRPVFLRPLRTPAPMLRRLAFVSPGVPPG